ncbi:MAG: TetR/AcrR family transcriptional regulator [Betaproteobacteria bacterium]
MQHEPPTDVRTRILEAALGLLGDHGVTELTQPKIAKAAAVRQSHLTYYFPTRAALLQAIALHSMQSLMATLSKGGAPGGFDLGTFAREMGEQVCDVRRTRVMLGLIVTSDQDPEVRQFLREFVATVRQRIVGLMQAFGRQPDEAAIAGFHTLMVGIAILHAARNDARSRKESAALAGLAVEKFLAGAAPVAPPGSPRRRVPASVKGE